MELLSGADRLQLTQLCFERAQTSSIRDFWTGLSFETRDADADSFENLYIPYIKDLFTREDISILIRRTEDSTTASQLIAILLNYVQAVNRLRPSAPMTWTRAVPECITDCSQGRIPNRD